MSLIINQLEAISRSARSGLRETNFLLGQFHKGKEIGQTSMDKLKGRLKEIGRILIHKDTHYVPAPVYLHSMAMNLAMSEEGKKRGLDKVPGILEKYRDYFGFIRGTMKELIPTVSAGLANHTLLDLTTYGSN